MSQDASPELNIIQAVEAERERCAAIVESYAKLMGQMLAETLARRIRRGK